MKKRLEATHFIEVYKLRTFCIQSPIHPIENLEPYIRISMTSGWTTIAIWKIKFKAK